MKKIAIALAVLTLAGCASDGKDYDAMLLDVQYRVATKDTLTVDCPAGCKVVYTDPRDRAHGIKGRTTGWDALINVTDRVTGLATTAVVPAAMYGMGKAGFDALRGSGTQTSTVNTSTSNNTSNVDSHAVTSAVDSHAVTTTTDNHAVTTDSTHAPAVVYQPAPIVVTP